MADRIQDAIGALNDGDPARAEGLLVEVLAGTPDDAKGVHLLGLVRYRQGRLGEAIELIRRSVELMPELADLHFNLGNLLKEVGRYEEAAGALQAAVRLRPNYPAAWYRLGQVLVALRRTGEAIKALENAVNQAPNEAEHWFELGAALKDVGRFDLAEQCWQKTLTIRPDCPGACVNLAHIRTKQGLLSHAIELLKRAIELKPDIPAAWGNLANALGDQGKLDEAVGTYRRVLEMFPRDHMAHSNLLVILNHHPDYGPARLYEEHVAWAEKHAGGVPRLPEVEGGKDPTRRIRVGYVSADFRDNQVGFFLEPLLANHDHERFFIKCYSDVVVPDAMTERMKRCADEWEHTAALSDEQFAERVRGDGIDVLVDLTVHAGLHRLLAFARRPVPVQMTYLGYPNTTGLSEIDYRITDSYLDPVGMGEGYQAEKLLRLPETYFCYRPSAKAPKVGALPYLKAGHVTFGSFNRLLKVTEPTIELWSRVLGAVPRSRLIVKGQGLSDGPTREFLVSRFAKYGVGVERLELHGWSDLGGYLELMSRVDVALDPVPFAGGTTTCHLLWQGVPTIVLPGETPVSRIGLSLLSNVGLAEFVAGSEDSYVGVAVGVAKDVAGLSKLRGSLRERMRGSALMDAGRFARNMERGYRVAWERYCAGLAPEHVTLA